MKANDFFDISNIKGEKEETLVAPQNFLLDSDLVSEAADFSMPVSDVCLKLDIQDVDKKNNYTNTIATKRTSQERENILRFVIKLLQNAKLDRKLLGDRIIQHQTKEHSKILAKCNQLETKLDKQLIENQRLCTLLDSKYPVKKLSTIAGASFLVFVLCLLSSRWLNTNLMHPLLAFMGLVGSGGFLYLAHWRRKNG